MLGAYHAVPVTVLDDAMTTRHAAGALSALVDELGTASGRLADSVEIPEDVRELILSLPVRFGQTHPTERCRETPT